MIQVTKFVWRIYKQFLYAFLRPHTADGSLGIENKKGHYHSA